MRILLTQVCNKCEGVGNLGFSEAVKLLASWSSLDNAINGVTLANVKVSTEHNALIALWNENASRMPIAVKFVEDSC